MANARLDKLRQDVARSSQRRSASLVGDEVAEAGLLDRAALNKQIEAILGEAAEKPASAAEIEEHLNAVVDLARVGDVPGAAKHVTALMSMQLDDLRKAALLSLLVRMAGKRHFDPVAAYVLQNRTSYATQRG